MGLHDIFVLAHGFYPSPLSSQLKDYSVQVQSRVQNAELADFNRLRYLVKTFQAEHSCARFSPLCEKCGKNAAEVSQVRSCRPSCGGVLNVGEFENQECSLCSQASASMLQCSKCKSIFCDACVTSMTDMFDGGCKHQAAKLCQCGEVASAHPWSKRAIKECHCGTARPCVLFLLKTFLAHDGLAETLRLIGSSSALVQRYSYTLLWLLCEPSEASLLRCRGGSRFNVQIEAEKNKKDEFVLTVGTATVPHKVRRKKAQMLEFAEALKERLKGAIELPEMPKNKSKAEAADLIKIHLRILFDMIALPESYMKIVDSPDRKSVV